MRILLGCGELQEHGPEDVVNVDIFPSEHVDRVFDLNEPLDYPEGSVDAIYCYHTFEHLKRDGIEKVVASWYRILKSGSQLILELPDFDALCQWALNDPENDEPVRNVFGSQDRMGQVHLWGWNELRLRRLFEPVGFRVEFAEPKDYHAAECPSLRMEAMKP